MKLTDGRWSLESRRFFAVLFLALCLGGPLYAEEHYLVPGHLDGIALLAPPPEAGSAEAAADLEMSRAAFSRRTPEETARAKKDSTLSFTLFAPAIGPVFTPDNLPRTDALMKKVKAEIGEIINTPKNYWKRQRPYQLDGHLVLWEPENSYSYPSGHSSRGTVYSLVLAELFPEKRAAIMAVGREIGWDRVLIGKHFLTDVRAGRVLGQAIVRELAANAAFQRDLAEAKAEIRQRMDAAK